MFNCKNGPVHKHSTVHESKICWGLITVPVTVPAAPSPTPPPTSFGGRVYRPSPRQTKYIRDLGGDVSHAFSLGTFDGVGAYITSLENQRDQRRRAVADPRLDMLKALIPGVPDGYFAVQEQDGAPITFLRTSHPKSGKFLGSLKIQEQHGPRWEEVAVLWPSDKWSVYKTTAVDALMLLVVDYQGAAMRYAWQIGKCCRCNSPLTDDRSRHYGIGPECDDYWTWVIEMVDERNDGHSFEYLRNNGLLQSRA